MSIPMAMSDASERLWDFRWPRRLELVSGVLPYHGNDEDQPPGFSDSFFW